MVGPATTATPTISSSCDGCPGGKPGDSNTPKWCNAEFDDLLVKARVISDQAERAKLYKRMQEIEHDEAPELLIAHSTVFEAMRANVDGLQAEPARHAHVRGRRLAVSEAAVSRAVAPGCLDAPARGMTDAAFADSQTPCGRHADLFPAPRRADDPDLLALMFLTFVAIRLVPGDPVEVRVGEHGISPERLAHLPPRARASISRCGGSSSTMSGSSLHGDFGVSLATQQKVLTEFLTLFPATLELSFFAMLFAIADRRAGRRDRGGQARRLLRSGADDDLAVRLFDADLLVGPAAHHVRLGDARLDAGLRPHRPHQLLFRPADRLHDDRRARCRTSPARSWTRCGI